MNETNLAFIRFKQIIGGRLRFQTDTRQDTEITVTIYVFICLLDLGRPMRGATQYLPEPGFRRGSRPSRGEVGLQRSALPRAQP